MNGFKKSIYFFCVLCCSFLACKKEKDKQHPLITISTPFTDQPFNVGDGMHVTGTITDESQLTKATINLLDEQGHPVGLTLPVSITASPVNIDINYALDDIHLETGRYQVTVFASDGTNDTYAYQWIYIYAVPRTLSKILVTTTTSSLQTTLSLIDSLTGSFVPLKNFAGDHLASAVSSYFQTFYHCGNSTGHFTGMDLVTKASLFDIEPVQSPPLPFFTGFYSLDKAWYVASYNELIKGYDRLGTIIYNAKQLNGYYAQHFCMNGGELIAEEQQKTGSDKKLVCYYSTGSARQSCSITQDVVSFCEKDDRHVFIFGNKAGQGIIQLYDRNANNLWNPYPYTLAAGAITCALKLDADTYLIAHSNGTIYKYVYSASSVTTYLTGYLAIRLLKEELSNTLFVVEKNKINRFDFGGLKPLTPITSADDIVDVNFLYNR